MHAQRTTSKLGVIERYRVYLPVTESTPIVSLGEGSTPLLHCPRLSERVGRAIFLKNEGVSPAGACKDRVMGVSVSKAFEHGAEAVICASRGNAPAAAAVYAALAG